MGQPLLHEVNAPLICGRLTAARLAAAHRPSGRWSHASASPRATVPKAKMKKKRTVPFSSLSHFHKLCDISLHITAVKKKEPSLFLHFCVPFSLFFCLELTWVKKKRPAVVDCQPLKVPKKGLEPSRLAAHAPETCASTNSATWALILRISFDLRLQRYNIFLNGQAIWVFFLKKVVTLQRQMTEMGDLGV